jgi:hypothetical protein
MRTFITVLLSNVMSSLAHGDITFSVQVYFIYVIMCQVCALSLWLAYCDMDLWVEVELWIKCWVHATHNIFAIEKR